MGRQNREDGPGRIFHITSRVNWQQWHFRDEQALRHLARAVAEAAGRFEVAILAWVLMVNHLDLVTQSPPDPVFRRLTRHRTSCRHYRPWPRGHPNASVISRLMKRVRRRVSVKRQQELGIQGRFWEGPYDARHVRDHFSLVARVAYDHLNPVQVGIVDQPEDYEWSSARSWKTGEPSLIPVSFLTEPFGVPRSELGEDVRRRQESRRALHAMDELAARGVDSSSLEGLSLLRELLDGAP